MNAVTTQQRIVWTPHLRPSPAAAEACLRILSIGELDPTTLALVIGSDPALTAAIVRASEPANPNTAVADRLAGLSPARLQSALFPPICDAVSHDTAETDHSATERWRENLATAIIAENLARRVGLPVNAAYLAGLLNRCGEDSEYAALVTLARIYRFPRWLVDCLEAGAAPVAHGTPKAELADVVRLARTIAPDITSPKLSESATSIARAAGIDMAAVKEAREEALESLHRRMSLFAFTPTPVRELRGSLLRFANQLLMHWRVDETAARALRSRTHHLEALTRFHKMVIDAASLQGVVALCADAMRTALAIDAGVLILRDDARAIACGAKWTSTASALEPLAPNISALDAAVTDEIWKDPRNADLAPTILPIRSRGGTALGYLAAASRRPADDWLESLNEWLATLGLVVQLCLDRQADDERPAPIPVASTAETAPAPAPAPAVSSHRDAMLARATVAALHGPLSAITSHAHQLVSKRPDPETHRLVEDIAKHARNAARVVTDLQVMAHEHLETRDAVLLNTPLRQFLHAARPRFERRSIVLEERYGDGIPRIQADSRRLSHLFTNLFAFIEHRMGRQGRTITVTTATTDDRTGVSLTIDATGVALTEQDAERLFAPLESYETAGTGHALALAACARIVHGLEGHISAAVSGTSTTFILVFPAAQPASEASDEPKAPPAVSPSPPLEVPLGGGHKELRVLLVDDDEGLRNIMCERLRKDGYDVICAADGTDAARVLSRMHVDAVLLDLLMPNRDGFTVLRDVRQMPKAPPVIVMTGSIAPNAEDEAVALGAKVFLRKPFELRQLLWELDSLLAHQKK